MSCLFQTFLRLLKKLHFRICHIRAFVICALRCKTFGRNKKPNGMEKIDVMIHELLLLPTSADSCSKQTRRDDTPESPAHQHLLRALYVRLRAHQRPPPPRRQGKREGAQGVVARFSASACGCNFCWVWWRGGKKTSKKAKRVGAKVILLLYRYSVVTCNQL